MKVGRNQVCPYCDSGRKFKRCCGDPAKPVEWPSLEELRALRDRQEAQELQRQQQQGMGRPVISAPIMGQRAVAVGNQVVFLKTEVFSVFLNDFLMLKMGREWLAAEETKEAEALHPIVTWRSALEEQIATLPRNELGYAEGGITGASAAYFGLAYSLYLIQHNAELVDHMLKRLRLRDQFQGAYFELVMINCLVRAGFKIEMVDETGRGPRKVELYATSQSGRRYSVEVKARAVPGVLGKTSVDGSPDRDPTNRIRTHLSDALHKPSDAERIVFIDLNAADGADGSEPPWYPRARQHLVNKERERPDDPPAYVFITNFCYHHHLASDHFATFVMPYGFHIPDFMKADTQTLIERYKEEKKHADAMAIIKVMEQHRSIPITFDGSLPSELPGMKPERRPIIGQPYHFDPNDVDVRAAVGIELEAFTGIVESAIAVPEEMSFVLAVRRDNAEIVLLWQKMSERQLREWEQHKETYFGAVRQVGKNNADAYDLFLMFLESHEHTPRSTLLEWMADWHNVNDMQALCDEDLRLHWAQAMVGSAMRQTQA
jgi:hypothetical protein